MLTTGNIWQGIPSYPLPDEMIQVLHQKEQIKIEKIVSSGQSSPPGFWYDQPQNEWVIMLSGAASIRLQKPDKLISLLPGDFLFIPAHHLHRVENTSHEENTVWLAFFYS